jgi:hypothetical protein
MAGTVQRKITIPPVSVGSTGAGLASQGGPGLSGYVEGSAAGLALPNSFLIPVEGVIEKDSVSILLKKAVSDMSPKTRVIVFMKNPAHFLGWIRDWYEFEYQNAFFILDRVAIGGPLKLPLKTEGKVMRAKQEFTNESGSPRARGRYKVSIEACNPGC